MGKILFACDMDNTLLYSVHHAPEDAVCVEKIDNAEQGFMTRKTVAALAKLPRMVTLLPVTTRSVEQYLRIHWPGGSTPQYALVTNGATLLFQNTVVRKLFVPPAQSASALSEIREKYAWDRRFRSCRVVDGTYVYLYCADGVDPCAAVREIPAVAGFHIELSGRKIYFFPNGWDKGKAVALLAREHHFEKVIAAGDSIIDRAMLCAADVALVPQDCSFTNKLSAKK